MNGMVAGQWTELTLVSDGDEVVVFIVSRHSNTPYRRVLWRVSRADAMKICSDPRTSGRNFMLCFDGGHIDDPEINRFVPDDGRFDKVLAEHGVTVLTSPGRAAPMAA